MHVSDYSIIRSSMSTASRDRDVLFLREVAIIPISKSMAFDNVRVRIVMVGWSVGRSVNHGMLRMVGCI
jgi:hypothetical protein